MSPPDDLAATLLHAPPAGAPHRSGRAAAIGVSGFVAYHLLALLLGSIPLGGAVGAVERTLQLGRYLKVTASGQNWKMFAPNPLRRNEYVTALIDAGDGSLAAAPGDIRTERSYPYLLYDRRAKIARRMAEQEWYQRIYGAWLCREWERAHGAPPREVRFAMEFSEVPPPSAVVPGLGYDWADLPFQIEAQRIVDCRRTVWAQLPDEQRRRFGMPPRPEGAPPFVPQPRARSAARGRR